MQHDQFSEFRRGAFTREQEGALAHRTPIATHIDVDGEQKHQADRDRLVRGRQVHQAHAVAGKPIEANASVNNGAKNIPWIKILNFNVTKDNLEQSAQEYSWWFQKQG